MLARTPIKENILLDLLLRSRADARIAWDPLLPLYVDGLCRSGLVRVSAALRGLLRCSSISDGSNPDQEGKETSKKAAAAGDAHRGSTLMTDIKVIQDTMMTISTDTQIPKSFTEAADIYDATGEWILALVAWHTRSLDESTQSGGLMGEPDAVSLFESLGYLLAALSGTEKGLEVLSGDFDRGLKGRLGQALAVYLPLCVDVSLPLRQRLEGLQKGFGLFVEQGGSGGAGGTGGSGAGSGPNSKSLDHGIGGISVRALQFEAGVMDGPVVNTRAGLYVYLNSMVGSSILIVAWVWGLADFFRLLGVLWWMIPS